MRPAKTLRELLAIRRQHADSLRRLNGYLGSAVGYKWREQDSRFDRDASNAPIPAVLIFLEKKKKPAELPADQIISPTLSGPDGLYCATDVIVGRMPNAAPSSPALSAENKTLLHALHEGTPGVVGGMTLRGKNMTGTAACVVRHRKTGKLGILTNCHISGDAGTKVGSYITGLPLLGVTKHAVLTAPETPHDLNDLESFVAAKHRLDCGYVELQPDAVKLARSGVYGLPALGANYVLNLDSLEAVGLKVRGLGQARGWERGTIIAYGYEWQDETEPGSHFATNYLIMGEANQPFAGPGDSGKLVITDDGLHRPLALLWGGERQQFWGAGKAQDSWAYASDLSQVLDQLDVDLPVATGNQDRQDQFAPKPKPEIQMKKQKHSSIHAVYPETSMKVMVGFDGEVVMQTHLLSEHQRLVSISVKGGTRQINTVNELRVRVLHGKSVVQVKGQGEVTYDGSGSFVVPANTWVKITARPFAQFFAEEVLAPILGDDDDGECILC